MELLNIGSKMKLDFGAVIQLGPAAFKWLEFQSPGQTQAPALSATEKPLEPQPAEKPQFVTPQAQPAESTPPFVAPEMKKRKRSENSSSKSPTKRQNTLKKKPEHVRPSSVRPSSEKSRGKRKTRPSTSLRAREKSSPQLDDSKTAKCQSNSSLDSVEATNDDVFLSSSQWFDDSEEIDQVLFAYFRKSQKREVDLDELHEAWRGTKSYKYVHVKFRAANFKVKRERPNTLLHLEFYLQSRPDLYHRTGTKTWHLLEKNLASNRAHLPLVKEEESICDSRTIESQEGLSANKKQIEAREENNDVEEADCDVDCADASDKEMDIVRENCYDVYRSLEPLLCDYTVYRFAIIPPSANFSGRRF